MIIVNKIQNIVNFISIFEDQITNNNNKIDILNNILLLLISKNDCDNFLKILMLLKQLVHKMSLLDSLSYFYYIDNKIIIAALFFSKYECVSTTYNNCILNIIVKHANHCLYNPEVSKSLDFNLQCLELSKLFNSYHFFNNIKSIHNNINFIQLHEIMNEYIYMKHYDNIMKKKN